MVINRFTGNGLIMIGGSTTVTENFIGTDPTGTIDRGNNLDGVLIAGGGSNTIGPNNLISGNTGDGVEISGAGSNVVKGNLIGHSFAGNVVLAQGRGVFIHCGSDNNLIGGATFADGNHITGATEGVLINGSGTTGNKVFGNSIGTAPSGLGGPGNVTGVRISGFASANEVGGDGEGEGNTISSNDLGVNITGQAFGNFVRGNVIGMEGGAFNVVPNRGEGVLIDGDANTNTIGGAGAEGNVISGNEDAGVSIVGSGSSGNKIEGNIIGLDGGGTFAVPNYDGIAVLGATGTTIGTTDSARRNVVSGNESSGIIVENHSAETVIRGNYVGLNTAGTAAIYNGTNGVFVGSGGGDGTVIGGLVPGAGNVLVNGGRGAVRISIAVTDTRIDSNNIGTDATGTVALGESTGIEASSPVIIARNLISGNGDGIRLEDGVSESTIFANRIGTAADAVSPLPNTGHGINVRGAVTLVDLGSIDSGANVIAFNGEAGVNVTDADANALRLQGNQIHDNGGLGIDLGGDGVTPNDAGDGDGSPNHLQNFPELTVTAPGMLEVSLNSTPNSSFTVTLYSSDECDASGHGEGAAMVAAIEAVQTDAQGNATFSQNVGNVLVTALATNEATSDTSEFSECVDASVVPTPTPVGQTPTPTPSPTPTGTASVTPTATGTATATATATPSSTSTSTASATPTSTPGTAHTQGDIECDDDVDVEDALRMIFFFSEPVGFADDCDVGIGDPFGEYPWGDVNCDGEVDLKDAIYILAFRAGITLPPVGGNCTAIGDEIA